MRGQKEKDSKREGSVFRKKHTNSNTPQHATSTHPGIMGPYKSAKAFTVSK